MKIGINIWSFENRGGIGCFSRSLVSHLISLFPDHLFSLYGKPTTDISFLPQKNNWCFNEINGSFNRVFWENQALTSFVNKDHLDIFHNPDYTVPNGIDPPSVVTVHDLSFKYYPKGISVKAILLYNLTTPASVKKAQLVMADSHFTKQEIIRAGWKSGDDIRVVHLGVDQSFFEDIPDSQINSVLKKYKIERGYILYLGALDRRKNIVSILKAYSYLKNNGINLPQIVLGGEDIGGGTEITNEVLKLGLGNNVKKLGFIPDEHKREIYRGARLFVFPSHYEGFGLPPLEAMASGVPVVTSEMASLPEIVADAGFLVPPDHIPPIAEAMRLLITDNALHAEYASKARERAKLFTWQKTASQVMDVYTEAKNKNRGL